MRTNDTTIRDGGAIYVYPSRSIASAAKVKRLSRRKQLQCAHKWCDVAYRGHGKWQHGCIKCGALGR
jgi:hypothetical protein